MSQTPPTPIRAIVFDCFGVLYEGDGLNRALVPIIEQLHQHYRTGILSNASRTFLDHFLRASHTAHLFDVTVASSETPYIKPQREIFEHTATKLGVNLAEILFIDDYPDNVTAARSYGITSILYQNPTQLAEQLRQTLT